MSVHPTPGGTPTECTAHSPELFVNQKSGNRFPGTTFHFADP